MKTDELNLTRNVGITISKAYHQTSLANQIKWLKKKLAMGEPIQIYNSNVAISK